MLGDIAIIVFALIAIFTGKRWAIITATIWAIVALIIGMTIGILTPDVMDTSLSMYNNDIDLDNLDIASSFLLFLETLFIIIGWIRVIFFSKNKKLPSQTN